MAASWARRLITGARPASWADETDAQVQFAVRQLRVLPGDRVLDLGCGWGRHSVALAAYGARVTGVDIARDLLTLARYTARRQQLAVDWVEADAAALPLYGCFEAVAQFCGNMLTWFATPQRTRDALARVATLLRPGGRFLLGARDWQPELPARAQHYDEWQGGAAIYRQRFDRQQRVAETQTVVFGPDHRRTEYRSQVWWPSPAEMEVLFGQVGLTVVRRSNVYAEQPYDPAASGLIYVLAREG